MSAVEPADQIDVSNRCIYLIKGPGVWSFASRVSFQCPETEFVSTLAKSLSEEVLKIALDLFTHLVLELTRTEDLAFRVVGELNLPFTFLVTNLAFRAEMPERITVGRPYAFELFTSAFDGFIVEE